MTFKTLTRRDPAAPLAPRAAWGSTCDRFVGRATVAPAFAVDGRDENHAVLWEAPLAEDAFWRSSDGYAIHLVDDPDWSPDTLLLLDPDGNPCGYYSGGEAWVDDAHRGRGLGAEMILAMTVAQGQSPMDEHQDGMGFSAAGLQAHRMAWCAAVERAVEAGHDVPPAHVAEASDLRLAHPVRPVAAVLTP